MVSLMGCVVVALVVSCPLVIVIVLDPGTWNVLLVEIVIFHEVGIEIVFPLGFGNAFYGAIVIELAARRVALPV